MTNIEGLEKEGNNSYVDEINRLSAEFDEFSEDTGYMYFDGYKKLVEKYMSVSDY